MTPDEAAKMLIDLGWCVVPPNAPPPEIVQWHIWSAPGVQSRIVVDIEPYKEGLAQYDQIVFVCNGREQRMGRSRWLAWAIRTGARPGRKTSK